MRRAFYAICVVFRSLTSNLAQRPIRFTVATVTIHNSHQDAMDVAKYSVLVSPILIIFIFISHIKSIYVNFQFYDDLKDADHYDGKTFYDIRSKKFN